MNWKKQLMEFYDDDGLAIVALSRKFFTKDEAKVMIQEDIESEIAESNIEEGFIQFKKLSEIEKEYYPGEPDYMHVIRYSEGRGRHPVWLFYILEEE